MSVCNENTMTINMNERVKMTALYPVQCYRIWPIKLEFRPGGASEFTSWSSEGNTRLFVLAQRPEELLQESSCAPRSSVSQHSGGGGGGGAAAAAAAALSRL